MQVLGSWERGLHGSVRGLMYFLSSWSVPSPPPPALVKKPQTRGGAKAAKEAEAAPAKEAGRRSPDPAPRKAEPSREIRNIIRMYQSRPGPVAVPVEPSRWAQGGGHRPLPRESPCGLLTSSFSQEAPQKLPEEKQS